MNIRYRTACIVKLAILTLLITGTISFVIAQEAVSSKMLISPKVSLSFSDMTITTMIQEPMSKTFHSRIVGDWLTVQRHNLKDDPDQWSPCYTAIESNYKPVVTKVGDKWIIEFVSEIAKDLP